MNRDAMKMKEREKQSSRRHPSWHDVPDEEWNDPGWQRRNIIRDLDSLERFVFIDDADKRSLESTVARYHLSVTPYYASLIDPLDTNDPIRRQAVPLAEENCFHDHELTDPLAEEESSPVPGLTHRYPDRVLLVTTSLCYMYCRHCTRKRNWKQGEAPADKASIDRMIEYVRQHTEVRDALVSGGDPLTLPLERLDYILTALRSIDHLEIIRIGSRIPVVMPMGITEELVAVLEKHQPIWLNTQFNHPREVTPEAAQAADRLLRAGIPVNNQSVLLKGVNDRPETMLNLNQALLRARVRPYYLFQCDPVVGTEHFRTPVEKGLEIMEALRGHTSGLAIPSYVIDLPGGGGKVPVSPNYIVGRNVEGLIMRNFEGKTFVYPEPPVATRSFSRRLRELVPSQT